MTRTVDVEEHRGAYLEALLARDVGAARAVIEASLAAELEVPEIYLGILQPALYEMSCHHFDCLMALFPDRVPEQIACDGFRPSWSVYAGPCMVNALVRFGGGLHVLYQGGFSSQADNYELRLEG